MVMVRPDVGAHELENPDKIVPRTAVINPYTLAELVAGRRIPWKRIDDAPALLESILQTPYEELFDPKFDSPLYLGFRLNKDHQLEPAEPVFSDVPDDQQGNDLDHAPDLDLSQVSTLADLASVFRTKDLATVPVDRLMLVPGGIQARLRTPEAMRNARWARIFSQDLIEAIVYRLRDPGFNPPNTTWTDAGDFFREAAEFFDPVQGNVANCYYISAIASLAWAHPYEIEHRTRATGTGQQQFKNQIRFYDIDNGNAPHDIEVTDAIIISNSTGDPVYCRSSESGEIWPSIYEKAFASWKTGGAGGDRPDITATAWGDTVRAAAELTGLNRHYWDTAGNSADTLWNLVRANSLSYRTFNPMMAWTYGSGDDSPDHVNYGDANIVASHAYSVLGWAYQFGQKYIVLRNPWASTEATIGTIGGSLVFYDVSWWRPIALGDPDGVFALRADVFKSYFAGLGAVS